ncbi:MAG: SufE family protein [Planctomycetaceae bacterium]
MTLDELYDEFEHLEDGGDGCDFLIDLGFELPTMPDASRTEENRVRGCQSNVWLIARMTDTERPVMEIEADSDAMIVRGLIAVLLMAYSGSSVENVLKVDAQVIFTRLGLTRHLSIARKNGLAGMVQRIRQLAALRADAGA